MLYFYYLFYAGFLGAATSVSCYRVPILVYLLQFILFQNKKFKAMPLYWSLALAIHHPF